MVAGVLAGGKLHWTYVGWLLLAPLVACRLAEPVWPRGLRVAAVSSAVLSTLTVGTILALLVFQPIERLPFTAPALSCLIGWDDAARRAHQAVAVGVLSDRVEDLADRGLHFLQCLAADDHTAIAAQGDRAVGQHRLVAG